MKRTIALYIGSLSGGGAEKVMSRLANALVVLDYRVILITTYQRENEYPVEKGVERIVLESENTIRNGIKKNIWYMVKIRKICRENNADLIISFMREPNVRALLATFGTKTKSIISVRVDPPKEYPGFIGALICRLLLPMADGCIFQTEEARSFFSKKLIKKSRIILNPVAKVFFSVKRGDTRNIIAVCRLERQKNIGLLIRAFSKIEKMHSTERLLIYGEGERKNELEKMITSLQLGEKVKLMGLSSDIPAVLAQAKVFVLSSDYEGLPNALMEALAVGVPSIATDCPCGGPRMLIDDGVNGLLVPVGDTDKMAEALDELLSDQEYAERLGNEASTRAAVQFQYDIVIQQWQKMIEDIIA